MNRRKIMLLAASCLILLATTIWSGGYMSANQGAAVTAGEDLNECRRLAAQIEELGRRPAVAADRERVSGEMATLIERAASSSGIGADRIIRISPEEPQRLGDSAYKEKSTLVLLKNVSLQQVVTMVHAMISGQEGLGAKAIRLSAPSAEDVSNQWTAELTITYLIYEPQKPQS